MVIKLRRTSALAGTAWPEAARASFKATVTGSGHQWQLQLPQSLQHSCQQRAALLIEQRLRLPYTRHCRNGSCCTVSNKSSCCRWQRPGGGSGGQNGSSLDPFWTVQARRRRQPPPSSPFSQRRSTGGPRPPTSGRDRLWTATDSGCLSLGCRRQPLHHSFRVWPRAGSP